MVVDPVGDIGKWECKIDGETATMDSKDPKHTKTKFKKVNDKWKLDLGSLALPLERPEQISKLAKALNEMAAEINSGKYKSAEEAATRNEPAHAREVSSD